MQAKKKQCCTSEAFWELWMLIHQKTANVEVCIYVSLEKMDWSTHLNVDAGLVFNTYSSFSGSHVSPHASLSQMWFVCFLTTKHPRERRKWIFSQPCKWIQLEFSQQLRGHFTFSVQSLDNANPNLCPPEAEPSLSTRASENEIPIP